MLVTTAGLGDAMDFNNCGGGSQSSSHRKSCARRGKGVLHLPKLTEVLYDLFDNENSPNRKVKHKSHIMKAGFLAVVVQSQCNTTKVTNFSWKIVLFPFTERVRAQRNTRSRSAGRIATKAVEVIKKRYKRMTIDHVIPCRRQCGG